MGQGIFNPNPILPGFDFFGLQSPKRRSYLEAEAERTLGVVGDVFEGTGLQLSALHDVAVTTGERKQVENLQTRTVAIQKMIESGNPQLAQLGTQELSKLYDDIDQLGTSLTANGIARATAEETRVRRVQTDSEELRGEMYSELAPIEELLDSITAINDVTLVQDPFALIAAAYKTVTILQGPAGGVISEGDIDAASNGLTTWLGWVQQQLATGAQGKGFTDEARNGLLRVLEPLGHIASTDAAQIIGRYNAFVDAGDYNPAVVFAGLERNVYTMPHFELTENDGTPPGSLAETLLESEINPLRSAGEWKGGTNRGPLLDPRFEPVEGMSVSIAVQRVFNKELQRQRDESPEEYAQRILNLQGQGMRTGGGIVGPEIDTGGGF